MKNITDGEVSEELLGFKLNMQILADVFEDCCKLIAFLPRDNEACLQGARFYRSGHELNKKFVYFIDAEEVSDEVRNWEAGLGFVVIGEINTDLFSPESPLIILSGDTDKLDVFETALGVFAKYADWDMALQQAINSNSPLDDMLHASIRIFNNPLFIHDTDFYVLSCPIIPDEMTEWETDPRTGRDMVPLSLINEYKINPDYVSTLHTREPRMFFESPSGYRILYANLWNGQHYEGRICVNEILSVTKKGDSLVLEYLAKLVELCTAKRNLLWLSLGKDVENFLIKVLDRKLSDEREIRSQLRFLGWGPDDRYVCIKLGTDQQDFGAMSPVSALSYIESQVAASHAFLYDESLVAVVNLTAGKNTISDVLSNLAILLREGLFKVGVSNALSDFMQLAHSYEQASIALTYGRKSNSMSWAYRFETYALAYVADMACTRLPAEFLCAHEIQILKEYDNMHHTNLSETLKTYLNLERNVVQTAKALFIHRSTLFYRLERIVKLTGADLENAKVRLYLSISYCMVD